AATQAVVDLSNFLKTKFHFFILFVVFVVVAFKKVYKTEKGRLRIDAVMLRLPVVGLLIRKVVVARFSRTMGTMLQSGVPILEALNVVARTSGNKVIEQAVYRVVDAISEGLAIAEPLEETGVFPGMVVQMINVGESTGALDVMLEKIADFYDEEVDQAVENLTSMIEPFMMVFLGGMIGGLVIALYMPIFKIGEAIQ
ncbi:type II secretion system F family protein, partial [bacterium]|nr:type II secretion system F family protein [bacterium]